MTKHEFDAFAKEYSRDISASVAFMGQEHDFYIHVKAGLIAETLASHDLKPRRTLDLGCGVGLIHRYLKGVAGQISGVDVSVDSVAEAARLNPDSDIQVYDGRRLPFDDATFDLVFTICVVHHVPPAQWEEFMREMRRVTRPGGLCLIIEHNPLNPLTRWVVRTCPIDENAVLLWPAAGRRLMRAAGFSDPSVRHFLFFPFDHPIWRRAERKMNWLPLGAQYMLSARTHD